MSRNINELHPRLQEKAKQLKELCEKHGMPILFSECLRTVAEQDTLYAKGRTTPGKIVTNAKGSTYSSQHQWGIAVDFYRNDGKGAYNEDGNFFGKVGEIAKSIGLGWGGDWTSIKDKPHLYLPDWGSTTTKLKEQYGTPEKFMSTWNTEIQKKKEQTTKTYLKKGDKGQEVTKLQFMLIAVGYSCGKSGADGIFGNGTKAAVEKFQKNNGLTVDGVYGEKTKKKLESAFSKKMNKSNKNDLSETGYKIGQTYILQAEMKVRTGPGTNYRAKKHSELTADGRKHDGDDDGALDKGTKVTCKEVKKVGNDIWICTPSGWIAAKYNGKVYVK